MSNYSPQMTEKMDSKWLPLATTAMDGGSAGFAGATNRSASKAPSTSNAKFVEHMIESNSGYSTYHFVADQLNGDL
jgi:hypothetical protein